VFDAATKEKTTFAASNKKIMEEAKQKIKKVLHITLKKFALGKKIWLLLQCG
jgi:hypothetical protein